METIHLLDGGFTDGVKPYTDYESLMKHPLWGSHLLQDDEEAIYKSHRDYIRAGADMITTNTYQASINGFKQHLGLDYDQSYELIKKSVQLCRRAIQTESSGRSVKILGAVGPFGASMCDGSEYRGNYIDDMSLQELIDWHMPRIRALIEAGVDYLLFETIPSIKEAEVLLKILSGFPGQKACLAFSCKDETHISHGETFASAVEQCWTNNAFREQLVAVGFNCVPARYISSLLMSVQTKNVPFIVYPNGGGVWDAENNWDNTKSYTISDKDLTLWKSRGLKILGGCCMCTAKDISHFRDLIDDVSK
ncbi:homocysteine S-methyltransferase YbgG-like isoform X2 [Adelges cooleyi]|uniref:homocysteine S-methyltransferase YbgG-like isoform X2 n=1 Tax=Adelges cooleyi TaxID=133065 RepID=UPI00217FD5C6|nr:homocysteine S-methyltransferase YbgG-like isoform X2 [Adelges cooleyi]